MGCRTFKRVELGRSVSACRLAHQIGKAQRMTGCDCIHAFAAKLNWFRLQGLNPEPPPNAKICAGELLHWKSLAWC